MSEKTMGGFGYAGIPIYELPEGETYTPMLLGFRLGLPFYGPRDNFNISVDLVPQTGPVFFGNKIEMEYGLNVMLHLNLALGENDVLGFSVSSGPHYISAVTERQAKGFIFSDLFVLHYRRVKNWSGKGFAWGIIGGMRHISNAGLKDPNTGINNIVIGVTTHHRSRN